MRILGIDPGTINLGYGLVDDGETLQAVDYGTLSCSPQTLMEKRLLSLYTRLNRIISEYRPDEAAIEEPFVGQNVRSALAIGKAQTIAILAAASQGLAIYYYSPTQIKQQVAGHGQANKEQIQEMVKLHLGLPQFPRSNDAADALAAAICHCQQNKLKQKLASWK